jgi:sulfoxide reductase catalytic subunit YedY
MLIKIPSASGCNESDVTPESIYLSRRSLLGASVAGLAVSAMPSWVQAAESSQYAGVETGNAPAWLKGKLQSTQWQAVTVKDEAITPFKDATHYNNFYEFGTDKGDPAQNAGSLQTEPWSVVIDGEVGKPGRYALEDFMKPYQLEERIYRLRCVEAWSMVIPWLGFPISDLLKQVEPTSKAKYIRFETLQDPKTMPGH